MEKALFRTLGAVLLLLTISGFSQSGETVNGTLLYHNTYPMNNVNVYLRNANGNIIQSTSTNSSGQYTFQNVAPGQYNVTFSSTSPSGGVTLTDAYMVMLHLFGLYPFNEIQALAADVNGSGSVTWTDYTYLLINYLTQGQQFPIGPWVFQPVSFTAGSRSGPGTSGGSSSGDANGTFVPTKSGEYLVQANHFESIVASEKGELSMSVTSPNPSLIGGMHLVMNIPEGLFVTAVESPLDNVHYAIDGRELRITWLDITREGFQINGQNPLFTVNANIDPQEMEKRTYSLNLLPESHFIGINGEMLAGIQLTLPTVNLVKQEDIVMNIYPNPFFDHATIDLLVAGEGNLAVMLYDNTGRLVREVENRVIPAGAHTTYIDGTNLAPGTYLYSISFEGTDIFTKSGAMIKSK